MSREEQNLATYDEIGKTYNVTRRADPRITELLINSLDAPLASIILDVGAGTGNYSIELAKHGFEVIAVEPSKLMRETGKKHPGLKWTEGVAEQLPAGDHSVDGIVSTLAIHHFTDLERAIQEMVRVLKPNGKLILFLADPRLCPDDSCWLKDYFMPIVLNSYQAYKPIETIANLLNTVTNNNVQIVEFPVPYDMEDCFFVSGWRKPELYLQNAFRAGVSPLANCPIDVLQPILERLERDLLSGEWDHKYGHLRSCDTYEGGYRFLIAQKA